MPWKVNIAHEIECSKGWKSRKRWGRARKLSKWQGCLRWLRNWSKPDCSICTDPSALLRTGWTETTYRGHQVGWGTTCCWSPKPFLFFRKKGQYRNSRCCSDRHKDIRLTEGGLGIDSFSMRQEVSRGHSSRQETSSDKSGRTHKLMKDWTLNCVQIRVGILILRYSLSLSGQGSYDRKDTTSEKPL